MSDIAEVVANYFEMWNENNPQRRRAVIEKVWSRDASSVDPLNAVSGWDGIDDMVAGLQSTYPGHRFRQSSEIDEHHDRIRFAWEFTDADGAVQLAGLDVVRLDDDGRFADLTGFFGATPASG